MMSSETGKSLEHRHDQKGTPIENSLVRVAPIDRDAARDGTSSMWNGSTALEQYRRVKQELADIVNEVATLTENLELGQGTQHNIARMRELILSDVFRIVVVGGFSRGKSTLINALFGEPVLPAKLAPCTAIINSVRYAEEPEAVLYPLGEDAEPLRIDPNELRDYVTIGRNQLTQDHDGARITSPYERVEIGYPLPLLRHGVEIVDTPGLEEDASRERITLSYLNRADAAVLVLSSNMLFNTTEERFVDTELKPRGYHHIFYVANYADLITSEQDRQDLRNRIEEKLPGESKVFFLSARQALQAKQNGDVAALEQSGFAEFERALEDFLVRERGQAKLQAIMAPVRIVVDETTEWIGHHLGVLERWGEDDIRRLETEVERRKEDILRRKERLIHYIGRAGSSLVDRAVSMLIIKADELARELPDVARGLDIPVDLLQVLKRNDFKNKVAEGLRSHLRDELKEWSENELAPALEAEFARSYDYVAAEVAEIVSDVERLKVLITPELEEVELTGEDAMERLLSAAGAFVLGDWVGVITGGALGFRGLMMHIAGTAVAGTLLWAIGFLNPVTAIATTLLVAYWVFSAEKERIVEKMQMEVVEKMKDQLRGLVTKSEGEIRRRIMGEMDKFARVIDQGINNLLEDAQRHLVNGKQQILDDRTRAIAEHQAYQAEARRLAAALDRLDEKIHALGN